MNKRIVVTGIGVISSLGIGKDFFWQNLIAGKSGISEVNSFTTENQFTHYGGEVKNFIPEDFMDKEKGKKMGRASHLAIAATHVALKDASLSPMRLKNYRTALCMGTTSGECQKIEAMDAIWVKQGKEYITPETIIQYPVDNISANVAREFELNHITRIFTTACAAGNYAIGYGFDLLQLNKADMIIAGGADAFSYISFTGFNQFRAVASQKCQPFDKNRKGMLPGEGAGVLILEPLENALKRDAQIYAEILGYGLSCDAYHMTQPDTNGIAECMRNALEVTGLTPKDVDYICAHGTGTKHNDRAECAAIKQVFADNYKNIAVSSIKSMLGHTMGAASAIEAAACVLAANQDIIPPTINYETPDPECDIDCVPNKARAKDINIVLNNGFAFGGNNACLVIRKYR